MRTYEGNVGKINVNTLPIIIDWLERHNVPYDEIYVGKPWCGHDGFMSMIVQFVQMNLVL